MLIELLEIFLGAFNYFFSPEDPNYLWFSELLIFCVSLIILITACICLIIILHDVLKFIGTWGKWR
ncbi:MAG: hypothetical protein NC177_03495 [Ruminococcus flavefaciens]|nr:hypothetical protein [Ruminococcus flavefaciens]